MILCVALTPPWTVSMHEVLTPFSDRIASANAVLESLIESDVKPDIYSHSMHTLGRLLGACVYDELPANTKFVQVVCTVEDADNLTSGIIHLLEEMGVQTSVLCLWSTRLEENGVSIVPVLKVYQEKIGEDTSVLVVVKSILSAACDAKNDISRVFSVSNPEHVFVVSPILFNGAKEKLSTVFPKRIHEKLRYIHCTTESENAGIHAIPIIKGYTSGIRRLGTPYLPQMIVDRRHRMFIRELCAAPTDLPR